MRPDLLLVSLQHDLSEQRRYVRELFKACCDQGHPEYWGMVAIEPLIEINAIKARIEALLYPGKRWMESTQRH